MSKLYIRKYQNKNRKMEKAYGKWYGRLVTLDTLTTHDLCKHIAKHGSVFTADVVKGVVEKFVNCFEELLLEGNKVKLDGLGTFYLTISTSGVEKSEDFDAQQHVKSVRMRFLPDKSSESEYTTQMLKRKSNFKVISLAGEDTEPVDDGFVEDNP
jgi:predicted histone-like DNA-binding protein